MIASNLPVVKAGVHSCSPVAPHSKVKLFDCATVDKGPTAECNKDGLFLYTKLLISKNINEEI